MTGTGTRQGTGGDGPDREKEAQIHTKLRAGSLKLYELEKQMAPVDAVRVRRRFIEHETGTTLENIGIFSIDVDRAATRNCENMIGAVQVPVGVAGPLAINGEYAKGTFWLPLATTEGALVASVNRGAGAITKAGGAEVRILHDGMTRAPVFAAKSVGHAKKIADWAEAHEDDLAAIAADHHLAREDDRPCHLCRGHERLCPARIRYQGCDGHEHGHHRKRQRLPTRSRKTTGARLIALSGNMCTDKKPAAINGIMGRGRSVVAGIALSHELVEKVLRPMRPR